MSKRSFSKSRRVAIAGGAAVVLGTAVAGAALANQTPTTEAKFITEPIEQDVLFIAEGGQERATPGVAVFSGVEPAKLKERRDAWLSAVAGKLGVTKERLEQAVNDVAKEQGLPGPLAVALPFPPDAAIAISAAPGEKFSLQLSSPFATAATALGMTEEQLKKEWPGKTLTEIARARNLDPKVVADAIRAQRQVDIDKAVADKKLTAEMATKLKEHVEAEIEMLMERGGFGAGKPVVKIERVIRGD
jgi:plasmid maintenance system antidote protein VapI